MENQVLEGQYQNTADRREWQDGTRKSFQFGIVEKRGPDILNSI
jgi:hypothetical protein